MIETLSQMPVWWANLITVVMFVGIALACFAIPRTAILSDAPSKSRWRDIRWWALALITVQLAIYAIFS